MFDKLLMILAQSVSSLLFFSRAMKFLLLHQTRLPKSLVRISVFFFSLIYLSTLIYFSTLNREEAIAKVGLLDPKLGRKITEQNYATLAPVLESDEKKFPTLAAEDDACAFTYSNVSSRFDVFIAAHFFGWFLKAEMIGNWTTLWIASILFEFCEVSFRHLLPNFFECWWDHWLLDILGCNLAGMWLGVWAHRYFRTREDEGDKRNNLRKFLSALMMIALVTLIDLNLFFLKFLLHIPVTHWTMLLRTLLFVFLSAGGVSELRRWEVGGEKTSDGAGETGGCSQSTIASSFDIADLFIPSVFQNSMHFVLGVTLLTLEGALIISWSIGAFSDHMSNELKLAWIGISMVTVGLGFIAWRKDSRKFLVAKKIDTAPDQIADTTEPPAAKTLEIVSLTENIPVPTVECLVPPVKLSARVRSRSARRRMKKKERAMRLNESANT